MARRAWNSAAVLAAVSAFCEEAVAAANVPTRTAPAVAVGSGATRVLQPRRPGPISCPPVGSDPRQIPRRGSRRVDQVDKETQGLDGGVADDAEDGDMPEEEEEEEDMVETAGCGSDGEGAHRRQRLPGKSGTLPFAVDGPSPPKDGPSVVPTPS